MTIFLKKGQDIELQNNINGIIFGVGWGTKSVGGFNVGKLSIIKPQEKDIDLDVSCLLFDSKRKIIDKIWYEKLRSDDGAIIHTGDSPVGGEAGADSERIQLRLNSINEEVKHIIFLLNSFSGESFKGLSHAYCHIMDRDSKEEIARFDVETQSEDFTGSILIRLYRQMDQWKIHAIGDKCNGRNFEEMLPVVTKYVY